MRVYVTFHVDPKRVDQMVDLATGLGSQIAFTQAPDIEVLQEKANEQIQRASEPEKRTRNRDKQNGGNALVGAVSVSDQSPEA